MTLKSLFNSHMRFLRILYDDCTSSSPLTGTSKKHILEILQKFVYSTTAVGMISSTVAVLSSHLILFIL
jgi:hypothetical protein